MLRQWDRQKEGGKNKESMPRKHRRRGGLDLIRDYPNPDDFGIIPRQLITQGHELNIFGESREESALFVPDLDGCINVLAFLNKNYEMEENWSIKGVFHWLKLEFFNYLIEKKMADHPEFEGLRELWETEQSLVVARVVIVDHLLEGAKILEGCLELLGQKGGGTVYMYLRKMLAEIYRRAGDAGSELGANKWLEYVG